MWIRGRVIALGCVVGVVASGCGSDGDSGPQDPRWQVGTGLKLDGEAVSVLYGDGPGTAVEGNDPRLLPPAAATQLALDVSAPAETSTPLVLVRNTTGGAGEPTWDKLPLLTVDSAGGLLARGAANVGAIPMSGEGMRMMWYPAKGAFRAGSATTQWDDASTGEFSWAGGNVTQARGYGTFAFGDACEASGTVAVCLGSANKAPGTASFVMGASSVASGFASVSMGYTNTSSGQGSVALGYRVAANADYSTALGYRASSGGYEGSFIWADASLQSPTAVSNTAANQFMVRAAGGVRLRTRSDLGTGCDLPAGSGVFSCTSDRATKEDFRRVDGEEVLAKVAAMPVESWRYKAEADGVRHMGPVAQDFRAAFGLGPDDKSIGLLDIDGVNMVAIQALARRTQELSAKSAEVDTLKAELAELKRSLSRLEAAVHARGAKP
ncbi:tail fiber domain-containing protein [Corallococcus sp. BB11-1]|uniref:tail fiber domain-containing protein n=1 Tax=Corallococcus sp. BB11-1 TaxID=2996783 RepID=UPI00226E5A0F|nr:tail fiber domain-containing protein [Corallococcus sp. BB11-1]MCY1036835.1 tail fiber domain-containing protein [Corallococcus sp. BB11-1]